jgi:hypothetical protein
MHGMCLYPSVCRAVSLRYVQLLFLWISESWPMFLISCLRSSLEACAEVSAFPIANISLYFAVRERYSATVHFNTVVSASGGRLVSLLPKKCRVYLAYSCDDTVWWCDYDRTDCDGDNVEPRESDSNSAEEASSYDNYCNEMHTTDIYFHCTVEGEKGYDKIFYTH